MPARYVARATRLRGDGPPRVVISHEDVTARKLAEEARAESEAVLRNFFDNAPALLGVVELEGDDFWYVLVNESSAGYMGLEPARMAGRRARELGIPEHLVELWVGKFRESRRIGEPVYFQYGEDGYLGARRMSGIACHLGASPGGRDRFAYIIEDVTEQRLAEETIAEQIRIDEYGRDVRVTLAEGAPMRRMMTRCAEAMVRHLGGSAAWIWILDDAKEVLELQGRAGLDPPGDGPPDRVPLGNGLIGRIAELRRPYLADDLRPGDLAWTGRDDAAAFTGYPLLVEERIVGVAAMVGRGRSRRPRPARCSRWRMASPWASSGGGPRRRSIA